MRRLSVSEYGRISKSDIGPRAIKRLHALDIAHERRTGFRVFDWRYDKFIRALNYVGVIQVPGLSIEILPKVDLRALGDCEPSDLARRNFLFMISTARQVKLTATEMASQATISSPIFEVLVSHFATGVINELRRGACHSYVSCAGNMPVLRGRIRFPDHVLENSARHDRLYVEYDEFAIDTPLNRILKSTCEMLARRVKRATTIQKLREIVLELADVSSSRLGSHHFKTLIVDRNSRRFAPYVEFCRLVLEGLTTTASHGDSETFGFLVRMNELFEDFIGQFLVTRATSIGIDRRSIHLQANHRRRWLLKRQYGKHAILLKPDIVIDGGADDTPLAIVDTKWKSQASDAGLAVPITDIYQIFAYCKRYRCRTNVLLLPSIGKVASQVLTVVGDANDGSIRIAYVDLSVDMAKSSHLLESDLRAALELPQSGLSNA